MQQLFEDKALLLVVAHGLITHLAFNRLEPRQPAAICALLVILPGFLSLTFVPYFSHWIIAIAVTLAIFYSVLTFSVVAYRLSPFHPLARYPGPTLDKISQLRRVWVGLGGKQYMYNYNLHQKYGDVVRIGPNEISICDSTVILPLYGVQGLPKGPMSESHLTTSGVPSLDCIRDRQQHAQRRSHWLRGLNVEALRGYEPIINKRVVQLVDLIENSPGSNVDLSQMMSYFSYDFMTDMAFGGGSEMMRDGDVQGLWHLQDDALIAGTVTACMPWLTLSVHLFPFVMGRILQFHRYAAEAVGKRMKGSLTKDLFYHLIDEGDLDKEPPTLNQVVADGSLAIFAGSDTTAFALNALFYYLISTPEAYARIQAEVDKFYPAGEDSLSSRFHVDMPYLAACINETLRLYPVLPGGSQRACLKGMGARFIGPYYIPEGTAVSVSTYAIHRDSRNFSPGPNTFWPERWLLAEGKSLIALPPSSPSSLSIPRPKDFAHNSDAYIPFSFGPANCVGKLLALKEMKTVVCHMMQRIDMKFADGYDPARWHDDVRSYIVLKKGELPISVRLRKS